MKPNARRFKLALPEETRHQVDELRRSRPYLKSTAAALLFAVDEGLRRLHRPAPVDAQPAKKTA